MICGILIYVLCSAFCFACEMLICVTAAKEWRCIEKGEQAVWPSRRRGHSSLYVDGKIVLFG